MHILHADIEQLFWPNHALFYSLAVLRGLIFKAKVKLSKLTLQIQGRDNDVVVSEPKLNHIALLNLIQLSKYGKYVSVFL